MFKLEKQVKLIWNSKAGGRITSKHIQEAEEYFKRTAFGIQIYDSESPQRTIKLIRGIAADSSKEEIIIVPVGGDGTINAVVNGIFQNHEQNPFTLGIIPGGTGNLLAQKLGILSPIDKLATNAGIYDVKHYCSIIVTGRTRNIDVIELKFANRNEYAVNWFGIGFTPEVIVRVKHEMKKNIRELAYLPSVISTLVNYTPQNIKVMCDDNECFGCSIDIGKNEFLGFPTFKYFKGAELDDGYLHTLILEHNKVESSIQVKILDLIRKVASAGHLKDPAIHHIKCKALTVQPMEDMFYHIDGETYRIEKNEEIKIKAKPRALQVIY